MAATTTSSNRRAAVSMISMCPLWMGSKDPGYNTFATVAPLDQQFGGRTETVQSWAARATNVTTVPP